MAVVQTLIGNVKGPAGATGATGAQGPQGDAATIAVGSVTSAAYGTPASVTNSGTSGAAVFDFVIPQGRPGQATTTMGGLTLDTITTSTDEFPSPAVDDTGAIAFGKIRKFFADTLSALASKIDTSKIANNLTTTDTSYVLSAAQGKALNDSFTNYPGLGYTSLTILLANSNTMTKTAGDAYGFKLSGTTRWLVFFEAAITCTTNRSANNAVLCFKNGDTVIKPTQPYQFPCVLNNEGTLRWCNRGGDNDFYICNPATWNTGTEFRVAGSFFGTEL